MGAKTGPQLRIKILNGLASWYIFFKDFPKNVDFVNILSKRKKTLEKTTIFVTSPRPE